jgi:hypothetical protein
VHDIAITDDGSRLLCALLQSSGTPYDDKQMFVASFVDGLRQPPAMVSMLCSRHGVKVLDIAFRVSPIHRQMICIDYFLEVVLW